MEQKVEKKNFFTKVWYSITKFEFYPMMAGEGLKRALKYLIMLTAIVSVFVMIGSLFQLRNMIQDLAEYVQNNIPEFSYAEGKISMEMQDTILIEDIEESGFDRIAINTLVETSEQKVQIENDNTLNGITVFFFNDEIVLKTKIEDGQEVRQIYTYSDFIAGYTGEYVESFNKTQFVEYLTNGSMANFYFQYGMSMFIYLLIVNIILGLIDAFEIAILGLITTTIARIKMKFVAIYNMAIYSLTLPMILNVLYIIINYFTDFTITYFQVAYVTIAYIYLAAAIFILKDDFIKKMQEVEKIKQEQIKVREEIKKEEEQEKKEKEEKQEEEDNKENNKDDEPQGSEA